MKAVIFDRDGVIINSESSHIYSVTQAFNKLGITITEEEQKSIIGIHPDDYTSSFLKKYDFDEKQFKEIQRKKFYEHLESVQFFLKIITLIKKLKDMNVPLALTTSSGKESTQNVIKKANLENIFDVIITREDTKKKKPNPEPYLLTAKKLNLNPKDCVVIEDTSIGVESAKSAGMKCIAIPNEYTKNHDFSRADKIINSRNEININIFEDL